LAITKTAQLVEYIYLDRPGIESLCAQIDGALETSRTTATRKGVAAKVGAKAHLRSFFLKVLTGLEGDVSAEVTGSGSRTEQSTTRQTAENRLRVVLDFLSESGEGRFFTSLSEAARHLRSASGPVFVSIQDTFNAPQFYGGRTGADSVNACGHLLLEKGGTGDYCDRDDYYKQPTALVKLSASVSKMRTGGAMGISSHEAIFIRGFGGRHVPLHVFGMLSGTSEYMQIKPLAIWK
jgi:hypothetical protein